MLLGSLSIQKTSEYIIMVRVPMHRKYVAIMVHICFNGKQCVRHFIEAARNMIFSVSHHIQEINSLESRLLRCDLLQTLFHCRQKLSSYFALSCSKYFALYVSAKKSSNNIGENNYDTSHVLTTVKRVPSRAIIVTFCPSMSFPSQSSRTNRSTPSRVILGFHSTILTVASLPI